MSSIFDISQHLLMVYEMAASGDDGDLDKAGELILQYEASLECKADQYAALLKVIDGEVSAIKTERIRLDRRMKSRENFAQRLKDNLRYTMEMLDRPKFKTTLHSFSIQNNPPALAIVSEDDIPPEYFVQPPPEIDRMAVKAALAEGIDVPGAALTQGSSLRIR